MWRAISTLKGMTRLFRTDFAVMGGLHNGVPEIFAEATMPGLPGALRHRCCDINLAAIGMLEAVLEAVPRPAGAIKAFVAAGGPVALQEIIHDWADENPEDVVSLSQRALAKLRSRSHDLGFIINGDDIFRVSAAALLPRSPPAQCSPPAAACST